MHRPFLATAVLLSALAVILGAFGAHGLKQLVPPETLSAFETGVRYHFYHSLGLLFTGMLYERFRNKWTRFAGYCFMAGIVLFSGSLYALTLLKAAHAAGAGNIGIITPLGGLCFIAGWVFLLVALFSRDQSPLKPV